MKNFILGLTGVLLTVMLSVVCTLAIDRYVLPTQTDNTHVWEITESVINESQNPQFSNTDDAMYYYETFVDNRITDSLLCNISRSTYEQIVKVLIGRNGKCDKKDILVEYLKNYSPIYQYLPPENSKLPNEPTIEGRELIKVENDSNNKLKDTVINGQLFKVQRE